MKYYIVKENEQLKIMRVKPELEAAFLAEYAGRILCSGDSMAEALICFGQINDQSGATPAG